MICAKDLTLMYRSGKGVFDVNFTVAQGTATGYLGPNGAGKTTTIRALMGFMRANGGSCTIQGLDCYRDAERIKKLLGYIPGEIAFPAGMSSREYLKYQCALRGMKDTTRMKTLMERFELDAKGKIKRFSKGMKQKLGIIAAFMHDPEVLILDEPTSGLDPLMQNEFVSLILEEKKRGKTILMSSHMFEEVERTCDDVLIIKEGRLSARSEVKALKSSRRKCFVVQTPEPEKLAGLGYEMGGAANAGYEVYIMENDTDAFIKKLSGVRVTGLDIRTQSLENIFLDYYAEEAQKEK